MGVSVKTDYLRGIGKADGRFILVLDIAQVLGTDEVLALGELSSVDVLESVTGAAS